MLSRWRARLSGADVSLAPANINISEGLRAATTCASIVFLSRFLHQPILSWAVAASFWTCLVDPGNTTRMRFYAMGSFAVLATFFTVSAKFIGGYGPIYAAPLLFACVFAGAFARVYGSAASQVGTLAAVATVVAIDRPALAAPENLQAALVFIGGCSWAMLLSLTIWRIHPLQPCRLALATGYRALASMTASLAELDRGRREDGEDKAWSQYARDHRRIVREALDQARLAAANIARRRGNIGAENDRFMMAVEVLDQIFAQIVALSFILEAAQENNDSERRKRVGCLRLLAALLLRFDRELARGQKLSLEFDKSGERLLRLAGQLAPRYAAPILKSGSLLKHLAADLPGHAQLLETATADRLWPGFRPIVNNLGWDSLNFRHALRSAVCTICGYIAVHSFGLNYGYWMTMTIMVIQQPYVATTWPRAIERVAGSVLGGGFAALLVTVLHSQLLLTAAIFPIAVMTMAVRTVNHAAFMFCVTTLFILIIELTQPGIRGASLAAARAMNTVLGGVIALIGCFTLWPSWEPDRLRREVANAIEANGQWIGLALRQAQQPSPEAEIGEARRKAGLSSNNAEASRQRALLESPGRREALNAAMSILAILRRLAGNATFAWLYPDESRAKQTGVNIQRWCSAVAAELAEDIRQSRFPRPWQEPDESVFPGDDRVILQQFSLLHGAVTRYLKAEAGNRSE